MPDFPLISLKIKTKISMLDLNTILATILDKFKLNPKVYSALAIVGSLLALVSMNPAWLPFTLSPAVLKFIGTLAVALLALTGSRTTSYLKPPPTISEEIGASQPVYR